MIWSGFAVLLIVPAAFIMISTGERRYTPIRSLCVAQPWRTWNVACKGRRMMEGQSTWTAHCPAAQDLRRSHSLQPRDRSGRLIDLVGIDWFHDGIVRRDLLWLPVLLVLALGGERHGVDITSSKLVLDGIAHLKTIHLGHQNIEKYQFGPMNPDRLQRFHPVAGQEQLHAPILKFLARLLKHVPQTRPSSTIRILAIPAPPLLSVPLTRSATDRNHLAQGHCPKTLQATVENSALVIIGIHPHGL